MKSLSQSIIGVFVLSVAFLSVSHAEDPLETGKQALKKGDLQTAISAFTEAVSKDKKNPEPYFWLGTALLQADSTDHAVKVLVQARELDPNIPKIYIVLGDAYLRQKIYGAAIPEYQKAIALDSTNAVYYIKLGESYRKMRQYNDFVRTVTKALALDSTNVLVNRELVDLYLRANPKQYSAAIPLLERLIKLSPDSLVFQAQLVLTYFHTNNFEKLIPIATALLQRDSNQTDVMRLLGLTYVRTRDNDNAVKVLGRLSAENLLETEDYIELAKAQKAMEQYDEAILSYEKAYRIDSTNVEIYYDLGTLYMKQKRYPEAIDMFERKIATDTMAGYLFASHLNEAMSLMQLKEFEKAKEHIQKSLELKPNNVQAWLTLAEDLGLMGVITDELAAYKKVIELANEDTSKGTNGKYDRALQEAYRAIGVNMLIDATKDKEPKTNKPKYAGAAEYLKKALQIEPKDCDALYYAAVAYQNSSNKEEAKRYYHRFLDSCPRDKRIEEVKKHLESLGE